MERKQDKKNDQIVVGVFEHSQEARSVLEELRRHDFSSKRVGILSHDRDGDTHLKSIKDMEGNKAGEGAAAGAAVGAGGGALWALGIAAGLLPAIGPVVAGGLLGAVLASGAVGAAAGGVAGALVGLGIDDEEAAYYDEEFQRGRTIVAVKPKNRAEAERALDIMRSANSINRYHDQGGDDFDTRTTQPIA
jgi:hypothetical protein